MKKLLVAILLIAALCGAIYFALSQKPAMRAMPGTVSDTTGTSSGAVETKTIKEEATSHIIDVDYRLSGIAAVDAHIEEEIQKAVNAFKNDAKNFDPEVESRPYTFSGEIADFYVGSDIVSERINLYQDTGGAHGLPIVLTLNYDATTGEVITLDRALSLIDMSLSDVAAKALAQLKQEHGESIFADGATATAENYSTFAVGPTSVTFTFQAYQVVAYAAGMPEVKFARK